ncbi:IPTL-CTERM sorting domain-containing protein [Diaphorobacter ruginosibacter]|uniref:IPTL-CTERM sorting domain-containing protein n=1 Tax=Diaphorobacter ruginosibacter TaxID=1715720 RepID=A0A7G9RTV2_9BURK|nr:IPTL-CTERM sorting domain-containing protein [Diaphorobacter ruginosibacter]QNN59027.1 IPTL-CTERM sorting domain-containing protein [Diaphorobacter ruginosibacter]
MLHHTLLAATLLTGASLASAQSEPLVQRDLTDRDSRFIDFSTTPAQPLYVVKASGGDIRFDASGAKIERAAKAGGGLTKSIGVHAGLSYAFDAGAAVPPVGQQPGTTRFSSFVGPQSTWSLDRGTFSELRYQNVWPGVDTVFKSARDGLKYQFELAAGADAGTVALRIGGADAMSVDGDGAIHWSVNGTSFRDAAPIAFQIKGQQRVSVTAEYAVTQIDANTWRVGFKLGAFDRALPLVIDPAWNYPTGAFAGGSGDAVNAVVRDSANKKTWVCGTTQGKDAFVAMVPDSGTTSVYQYGGATGIDTCNALALDAQGNVYIAGSTESTDFITLGSSVDTQWRTSKGTTDKDAYAAKINPANGARVWSGMFGGTGDDQANAIAVDSSGQLYVTGFVHAACPSAQSCTPALLGTSTNPPSSAAGSKNAFIASVRADGQGFNFLRTLNSDGDIAMGNAISVTSTGIVVAGETNTTSGGIPNAPTGFNRTPSARPVDGDANGDMMDGFVARILPDGSGYGGFTLLSGASNPNAVTSDRALGVKQLDNGDVLVVGETNAGGFPSPMGAGAPAGDMDGFIVRLSNDLNTVKFAQYLGGAGYDSLSAVLPVNDGSYYVLGSASGRVTNLTTASPSGSQGGLEQNNGIGSQDALLARFKTADNALDYWGLFGSSNQDAFSALSADIVDIGSVSAPQGRTVLYAGGSSNNSAWAQQTGEVRRIDSYGPPSTFEITEGNQQSVQIYKDFADVKVRALDKLGQPIPRLVVSFKTGPTTATANVNTPSRTTTITTDADGYAVLGGLTANGYAGGPYTIAVSAGSATKNIELTNLKGDQLDFAAVTGTNPLPYNAQTLIAPQNGVNAANTTYQLDPADTTASTYCTLTTGQVTAKQAGGSCTVLVTDPGNSNYNPAETRIVITTIKAAQPGFAVIATPPSITFGATSTLSTTNALSSGPETFAVDAATQDVCTINGLTVSALKAGSCKVIATEAGDGNYASATASKTIEITKLGLPPLSLDISSAAMVYGQTVTLSAAPNASDGVVTYSATGACTVQGTQLTATGVGDCDVVATQAANDRYEATSGTLKVVIGQAEQAPLVLAPSATSVQPGQGVTFTTQGGTTQSTVVYSLAPGSDAACALAGNVLSSMQTVSCTVIATMPGNANYQDAQAAPVTVNFSNAPQAPITVSVDRTTIQPVSETATVTASGGSGIKAFVYALISGDSFCSLDTGSGLVTPKAVGICEVNATNPASLGFDAATSVDSVIITVANKAQETITLTADKTSIAPGETAKVTAGGGSGAKSFSYAVTSATGICSVDPQSGVVTAIAVGACSIKASNPASTGFDEASSAPVTINVANKPQDPIKVSADRTSIALNGTAQVTATGGSGVIAYTYTLLSGGNACSLDSATGAVQGIAIGSCTINAKNAASGGYDEATSTNSVTISVGKAPQEITFTLPSASVTLIAPDMALSATTDATGLTVNTFASKTTRVCEVEGSTLKFYTAGTCTVTASQPGNGDFAAAEKDASVEVKLPAGTSATVTGSIKEGAVSAQISGDGWTFGPQNASGWEVTGFFPLSGETPPSNLTFPAGLFGFTAINGPKGTPVTITLTYPITFPSGAQYWKYGKTADNPAAHWYQLKGAVISGNTVTFSVTDGGLGDHDLRANSVIKDPGGVAINKDAPSTGEVTAVPTLNAIGLWMLSLLVLALGGVRTLRRRA